MTHPISEKKLDVAALLEGTTPGPWEMTTHGTGLGFGVMQAFDVGFMQVSSNHTEADAALIAAAPQLAAEHIALTKKVDELEAALRALMDHPETVLMLGGNPITIERVIEQARTALNDTTQCRESDNG